MPKPQIRILGVDDAPFVKGRGRALVIGTVFRGGEYMDGLLSTHVEVDGLDSTKILIDWINKSRNKDQLSVILTDGIALGGFNIIDIQKLSQRTNLPVIIVIRDMPNFKKISKALDHLPNKKKRLELIAKAGPVHELEVNHRELREGKKIYFQFAGASESYARRVLNLSIKHGLIPEPIRIAHIIGQGLVFGESRGRA